MVEKMTIFDPQKGTPKKASFLALANPMDSYLALVMLMFNAKKNYNMII